MFLGAFHCTTDNQGNLVLPKEIQVTLAGEITLTRGIERCLLIYPAEEWRVLTTAIHERLRLTQAGDRAFARLMFSAALRCTPDADGCVPLPEVLRQYADIQGEVVVVGLYNHLELWNARRWAELTKHMERQADVTEPNEGFPMI